jgi:hypothetical protein
MKILKHTIQPTTPIRGIEATAFRYGDDKFRAMMQAANRVHARGKKSWRSTVIKWKKASRGLLWRGVPFYWSEKGYYRAGHGDRRPVWHLIYEFHFNQKVARGKEVWFKDRDRHNFTPENMELLSKEDCHRRLMETGEVPKLTPHAARKAWDTRGRKNVIRFRQQAALLQQRFEQKENHEHTNDEPLGHLVKARDASRHATIRATAKAGYARRKAAGAVRKPRRVAPLAG